MADDIDSMETVTNRFASAESVSELLGQMVGAGSTCWDEEVTREGNSIRKERTFDSTQAIEIVDEGYARLKELTKLD